jgi:Protein of unknown function (DUF2909)
MKYYLIASFIAIAFCLGSAGLFLMKDTGKDPANLTARKKRMAWALTWRIGLSVCLFISLWIFYLLGWIKPTGLPINAMQ